MLRFKQFLILEDTTITQRQYLQSVYGKENAEKIISSIRQRENELGGTEEFLKYANGYHDPEEKKKDELSTSGLNPDLINDPETISRLESKARSASRMNDAQIKTFNTFAVPDYSDKNLDRPVDVKVMKMEPHPDLVKAGKAGSDSEPLAWGFRVGNEPENTRGTIGINKDYSIGTWANSPEDIYDLSKSDWFKTKAGLDTFGHELTHTTQPNWNYDISSRSPLPQTEYNSDKPASPETLQRRTYTTNPYEPAARMSELKHLYYAQTKKLLPANMTPEEKEAFKSWYNTSSKNVKDNNFDDTVQLLDTPEGDELFRRTAKVNKPSASDTRLT